MLQKKKYPPNKQSSLDNPKVAFGMVLRKRRLDKNLTQEQLSWITLIDRKFISAIERGQREPCLLTILKLSTALDCSSAEILQDLEAIIRQP